MKTPRWISVQEVLVFHAKQLRQHGGLQGIRDKGLLEAAVVRPQQLFAYHERNLYVLATSYAYGIAKNHPFLDGNKRTAIVTAGVFLHINGFVLEVREPELVQQVLSLIEGSINEKNFADWLQKNSLLKNFTH